MSQPTDSDRPLRSPLDEYSRQLESVRDDARELTAGLSRAQINWSPAPEKWSIAQCLAHLNSVAGSYTKAMGRAIEQGWEQGIEGDTGSRYSAFERWFIRSMEPPPKRALPAPALAKPPSDHDIEAVVEPFLSARDRLGELMQRANGLDLRRIKLRSPFAKLIKFRLGAAFAFIAAHERRHVWQAWQVRRHPGFPDS